VIVDAALPSRWSRVNARWTCGATSSPQLSRPARDSAPPEALLHRERLWRHEMAYVRLNSSIGIVHDDDDRPYNDLQDPDWVAPGWTGAGRSGRTPSETDEHRRSTTGPQWTNLERSVTCVSAGQIPDDVARPKGFEPLTF